MPVDAISHSEANIQSRALAKGLQILETLAAERGNLTLGVLAERIGLGKASAYRLLQTLTATGHVAQQEDQGYALCSGVPQPIAADWTPTLIEVARPELESLNAELSETISLAVLRDDHIRVIDTIESPHHIRLNNYVGRILAPYGSSLGKAIAAWQTPELLNLMIQVYGIYQLTENTITDPNAIRLELARVRERGYSWELEETIRGGRCYGAPIYGPGKLVKAAISVAMPLIRFTMELETRIPAALCAATSRISARIGGVK